MFDLPPNAPQSYVPVLVAEAPKTPAPATLERTIGVCQPIDNRPELRLGAVNTFTPVQTVNYYFNRLEDNYLGLKGTTTLLEGPKHGELEDLGTFVREDNQRIDSGARNYAYRAKGDYIGPDQATFLVEIGGYKAKVVYHFSVMPGVSGSFDPRKDKEHCPNGYVWKISLNPDERAAITLSHNKPSEPTR